jgi:UDP-glucose 4-epimerase
VTGGAGFIGSHLVDTLLSAGHQVTVLDNLTRGELNNLSAARDHPRFRFVMGDTTNIHDSDAAASGCDTIFHLAANPEVRLTDSEIHFEQNLYSTYRILEAAVRNGVKEFVFTSSSTVYGEPKERPTPESYFPLTPISLYGTCKLASEALVAGYCHSHRMRGIVLRFANIVGPRAKEGVVVDFVRKLKSDPRRLEILGDGSQTKSYLLVHDCVDAMLRVLEAERGILEIYNMGAEDAIDVDTVAKVVSEQMNFTHVEFSHTGGVDGGRGWVGDVKQMWLDISKLKALGWSPRYSSSEAVREATRMLIGKV